MPYPNEHACRINEPGKYDKMRRQNNTGKTPDMIFGIKGGKLEVQAYRFPKERFSESEARSFCQKHDGSFESASNKEQEEIMDYRNHNIKELRGKKVTEHPDGSKTYHDVTLLGVGVWTDSKSGQRIEYTADVLEKYATNWAQNRLSIDHDHTTLGTVGEVINQYYNANTQEIRGDLTIDPITQPAKDIMALVDKGRVKALSTEVKTIDTFDPKTKRYKAQSLEFYGQSIVLRGACPTCTLSAYNMDTHRELTLTDNIKYNLTHHADDGGVIWNNVVKEMKDVLVDGVVPYDQRKEIYEDLKNHYIEYEKDVPKFHNIVEQNGTFFDEVSGLWSDEREKLIKMFYKEEFMTDEIKETPPIEVEKTEELESKESDVKELSEFTVDEIAEKNTGIKALIDAKCACESNTKELQAKFDKDVKEKDDTIKQLEKKIKELEETKIQKTMVEHTQKEEEYKSDFEYDPIKGVIPRRW